MKRRQYIKGTGAAVTGSALAGCAASGPSDSTSDGAEPKESSDDDGSGGTETGTLATSVTDQPVDIDDFESCVITVEGLWVKPDGTESDEESNDGPGESSEEPTASEDDGGASEGVGDAVEDVGTGNPDDTEEIGETEKAGGDDGRRYIEFDEPQEADLVRLQGANTQLIDETELVVGSYRYLQLEVSGIEGVLSGGGEAEIDMPGNAPLQFKRRFEIRSNERTGFVADFAPVRRGQGDRYLLRPVAKGTQVLYGDEEYDPGADGGDVAGEDADDEDRSDAGEESDDVGED